jgi:DNA-binding CsgD family transcriptional regulator
VSRALVIQGEAGIGKTALLRYLVDSAEEIEVLYATGMESEMELAYASLHQLCGSKVDLLTRLPGPQRAALETVFGLGHGGTTDRFVVGLGVLTLLSEVAEEGPLLCVIDDAQWLDQESAAVLSFVARRVLAEPIGLVLAAREPGPQFAQLHEMPVRGLRDPDARALLALGAGSSLDARVRDRIVAESRGNPLALLELPRGETGSFFADGGEFLSTTSISDRLEQTFAGRLEELSDEARRLLLLAAAEPLGDPLLLLRASARAGIEVVGTYSETDGLLVFGERVTFRHPLVRSAVYRAAAPDERRAAHLAIAEATDHEADPDRRAWHLACAASGPDEQIAAELERSAGRAQDRGGLAAAAAFLRRAVVLTREPDRRTDRAIAAAQASLHSGGLDAALRLLASAETGPLDHAQRARIDLVRAQLAFAGNRGREAPPLLLNAARQLASVDPLLSRETYLEALYASLFAGRLAVPGGDVRDVARAAALAPPSPDRSRPTDLLLDGYVTAITEGYTVGAPILKRAVSAFSAVDDDDGELLRWGFLVTHAAHALWDEAPYRALPSRHIELARQAGALAVLPISMTLRVGALLHEGEMAAAAAMLDDLEAVVDATGIPRPPFGFVALGCARGRETEVRTLVQATLDGVVDRGEGLGMTLTDWLTATLYNSLGRYPEALVAASSAREQRHELQSPLWLHEFIEAAVRSGERDLALEAVAAFTEMTGVAGSHWALGMQSRCRALVSAGAEAEELYCEAIRHLAQTRARVEHARTRLLYGEWLRREGRRIDARTELRGAHETFAARGWEAFANRARTELLATGERVRRRTVDTRDDLTAQERQIAVLARDGLSNPEIGARMFLSPRTVEWHLRKVFAKLDINSRRELAGALPSGDRQTALE